MGHRWWRIFAALAFSSISMAGHPAELSRVSFPSATLPPSPLKLRLARERGETVIQEPGLTIAADLQLPDGAGPHPAIIMLHGCAGPSVSTDRRRMDAYSSWGYAVLNFDSFGARNAKWECQSLPPFRRLDALGALDYMAQRPDIDPARITIIGFSQGAGVALSLADPNQDDAPRKLAGVVAYYPPWCPSGATRLTAPGLLIVGDRDDWTPSHACITSLTLGSSPVDLLVIPGAHHAFDELWLKGHPTTYLGHHLEYDAAADERAMAAVRTFLSKH